MPRPKRDPKERIFEELFELTSADREEVLKQVKLAERAIVLHFGAVEKPAHVGRLRKSAPEPAPKTGKKLPGLTAGPSAGV